MSRTSNLNPEDEYSNNQLADDTCSNKSSKIRRALRREKKNSKASLSSGSEEDEECTESEEERFKQDYPEIAMSVIKKDRQLRKDHELMLKVLGKDIMRSGNEKAGNSDSEEIDSFSKLICPLCLQLMFKCMTSVCGHSFCEGCIDEYMLVKSVSLFQNVNFIFA